MSNVIMKTPLEQYLNQRLEALKESECDINTYRELKALYLLIDKGDFNLSIWE